MRVGLLSMATVFVLLSGCMGGTDKQSPPTAPPGTEFTDGPTLPPPTTIGPGEPFIPPPTGVTLLPHVRFESCLGHRLVFEIDDQETRKHIPSAFRLLEDVPGIATIFVEVSRCPRVVAAPNVLTNVSILYATVLVTAGNRSWEDRATSHYVLDFLVDNEVLAGDLTKYTGQPITFASVARDESLAAGDLHGETWKFGQTEYAIQFVEHAESSEGPLRDSGTGRRHWWTGEGEFVRVDVMRNSTASLAAVSGARMETSGNTALAAIVGPSTVVKDFWGTITIDAKLPSLRFSAR